jgi:hypothetical protein
LKSPLRQLFADGQTDIPVGQACHPVRRVGEEGTLLSVMTLKSHVRRLAADGQTDIRVGQACYPARCTEILVERRERRGQRTTGQMNESKSHIVDFPQCPNRRV